MPCVEPVPSAFVSAVEVANFDFFTLRGKLKLASNFALVLNRNVSSDRACDRMELSSLVARRLSEEGAAEAGGSAHDEVALLVLVTVVALLTCIFLCACACAVGLRL